jgi:lipopolysaccharide/colanic/teichoic acid biosynthesis glycosyltransferase
VSTESYVSNSPDSTKIRVSARRSAFIACETIHLVHSDQRFRSYSDSSVFIFGKPLSSWSRSGAKRVFDCACVLAMMPMLVPVLLVVALAVRLTSAGPVLFLQKRMGRHGRNFTILKFRTMTHLSDRAHQPVTTSCNQHFTPVGPFLRRWKLDELPQLLNVLAGHMSLVGPRPKLPVHAISNLSCRAGITGAATIAFALEERVLDRVPKAHLESFYHKVVLPAKHKLDADYMANATFLSDFKLLVNSVLRRWDPSIMEELLDIWALEQGDTILLPNVPEPEGTFKHSPILPQMDRPAPTGQSTAF